MNFFRSLFGGGKKKQPDSPIEDIVIKALDSLIEKSGFDLSFKTSFDEAAQVEGESTLTVNFTGVDVELLKEKEGQLLDAIQLFAKRVVQHNFPKDRTQITLDTEGFREESSQALIDLANKLKDIALEKGKPVYFRALSPKDRKIVHQYFQNDEKIKSRSIGDGIFKKIKIYPQRGNYKSDLEESSNSESQ